MPSTNQPCSRSGWLLAPSTAAILSARGLRSSSVAGGTGVSGLVTVTSTDADLDGSAVDVAVMIAVPSATAVTLPSLSTLGNLRVGGLPQATVLAASPGHLHLGRQLGSITSDQRQLAILDTITGDGNGIHRRSRVGSSFALAEIDVGVVGLISGGILRIEVHVKCRGQRESCTFTLSSSV